MSRPEQRLEALDIALDSVRNLWQRSDDRRRFLADVGEPVEVATLRVLRAVERAEQPEPCVGDVADTLMVDASTASRFVDQAVLAGYVLRSPSTRDRRKMVLSLTPDGERVLAKTTAVRRDRVRQATAGWSAGDIEVLTGLLVRLQSDAAGHPGT